MVNSTIVNNIVDARDQPMNYIVFSNSSSNSISNNICLGHPNYQGLPTGNGNVNGADPFTTYKVQNPWSINNWDDSFKLAANSPANTVGIGGTEAELLGVTHLTCYPE